jgi:peptide/nickel transport system substrate-binding protein
VVVVAPKNVEIPKIETQGKKLIIIRYEVDTEKTKPPEQCRAFSSINPAFYRNTTIDALIMAGRRVTNPEVREAIYEAVYKLSNYEVPILWLGQYIFVRTEWSWLHGRYYHPTLAERYDLLWEDPNAPSVDLGFGGYKNNASTYVIATIGWPQSFDPAANYETFGWAIFHNIGDTLVTYWKEDTTHLIPDLAVAWVHDKSGTTWYFVIRDGVKAYDPWHKKVYDISAIDVLFTLWRIARLGLDPSWMITEFVDVNASKVLSEKEFDQILAKGGLYAEYKDKTAEPKSLKELLSFFGYNGPTAGVVVLKLKQPYPAILSILADPFTIVIPMKYLFDNVDQLKGKYEEALKASDYGKNPAAWARYIGSGEEEPTHVFLNKYPIGTGPYYIADYQRDSYIVLKYNPYYWNKSLWNIEPYGKNGMPSHKIAIYLIQNDAVTRIQVYKAGKADTAAVPTDRLKEVENYQNPKLGNWKIIVEKGGITPDIVYIVLNAMKPPFNNRLVRQALMYAIPFDQIAQVVYSGFLAPLYGVLPTGFLGHNDNIVIHYHFDLDKAKELIKKSGIDPTKYSFEIWYNQGNRQREQIATLLQQTWGRLGFQISVKPLSWPTLLEKTAKGDFDVYIIGWAPDYLDPDDYAGPLLWGGTYFKTLEITVQG